MKTCLISGGGVGIGAAIAERLNKSGYNIIINYCHSETAANALAARLDNAVAIPADVSVRSEAFELVKKGKEAFGKIDLLVNNAGISQQKLFTDITEEEFDKLYQVNLKGAFNLCQAVLPEMISCKSGSIINISSIWGINGASCEVGYSAMKAALIGLTKALAQEVGPSGITVNCVAPGVIMTDMCKNLGEETLAELKASTPLMRLGQPQDIAEAVAFLASDAASFITGQTLNCSGGFVI